MAIIPFNRTWYPTEKEVKRYGVVTDADALERFKHALDNNPGLVWFERVYYCGEIEGSVKKDTNFSPAVVGTTYANICYYGA